jgi:hypothetical protein
VLDNGPETGRIGEPLLLAGLDALDHPSHAAVPVARHPHDERHLGAQGFQAHRWP